MPTVIVLLALAALVYYLARRAEGTTVNHVTMTEIDVAITRAFGPCSGSGNRVWIRGRQYRVVFVDPETNVVTLRPL